MASRIIDVDYYAGGDRKVVTSVDVYKSIRALQLEGVTSQRATAKILGISRNTVKNCIKQRLAACHGTLAAAPVCNAVDSDTRRPQNGADDSAPCECFDNAEHLCQGI